MILFSYQIRPRLRRAAAVATATATGRCSPEPSREPPSLDPAVGLYLGPCGGPRGGCVSFFATCRVIGVLSLSTAIATGLKHSTLNPDPLSVDPPSYTLHPTPCAPHPNTQHPNPLRSTDLSARPPPHPPGSLRIERR